MIARPEPCTLPVAGEPSHPNGSRRAPKIDAPVRSLEMLDLQLRGGAEEVYAGLGAAELDQLTFNAYAVRRNGQPTQVTSPQLLAAIVEEAHTGGVEVNFSANVSHLPGELHPAFVDHVRAAGDAGVDRIIVGSLPLMTVLRDGGVDTPFVASGTAGISTTAAARLVHNRVGLARVVLPSQMLLGEIAAFCAQGDWEVEVQVQTGSGLGCGRCTIWDSPVMPSIGLGCRAGYTVTTPEGDTLTDAAFLDGATDCALCDVAALVDVGVHALQIPGRDSPNIRVNAKMTQLYRRAIDGAVTRRPIEETIADIDRVELLWQMSWLPRFCDQQRCRFRDTPTVRSYV